MFFAYEFASLDTMAQLDTETGALMLDASKIFVGGHKWRRKSKNSVCHVNNHKEFPHPFGEAVHGKDRNEVLHFDFISMHQLTPKSKHL